MTRTENLISKLKLKKSKVGRKEKQIYCLARTN